ncbi:type VI secretion system-associated protein VasI [Aeromonas sp. sif2416]|uniref:type VI secretion system-associated protein VasI n=1 Tax=Aeromonas sp. sif2416 TaxID=2854793 RepID=UPI001C475A6D|nr:type VI secretion system-associated protein VasI [Aeromonas sp. sif2416]MBV7437749.1 type VI secretion system-associated protein TagO [Aeromonas sp. sif2416]
MKCCRVTSILLGLIALGVNGADLQTQLDQCYLQAEPTVRLSCYDQLSTAQQSQPTSHSSAWHEIYKLEHVRTPEMPPFMLSQNDVHDTLFLTRPALHGATLSIGCVNSITHIRVQLDAPWPGDKVTARLDGGDVNDNWFVRDHGSLLEYGRGLPAIEELKRWILGRELTLQYVDAPVLRFDLSGLAEALNPLRQQCRW